MRRTLLLSALALLAVSASATDAWKLRVTVTDGRSALLANPRFAKLNLAEDQLERAAQRRAVMLDRTTGTKFEWLMLTGSDTVRTPEHTIGERGSAKRDAADLGFTDREDGTVRVRCLRAGCRITIGDKVIDLKRDETADVASGSELGIAFRN